MTCSRIRENSEAGDGFSEVSRLRLRDSASAPRKKWYAFAAWQPLLIPCHPWNSGFHSELGISCDSRHVEQCEFRDANISSM